MVLTEYGRQIMGRPLAGATQSHFWVLFGSIWLLVGLPFLLLAGYFLIQERQLASGRVVEAMVLTKNIGGSGDQVNRSVTYRFTDGDGQSIEGKSDIGEAQWNSLTERGPVSVAYLPTRPSVNRVVGSSKLTLLLIFSFVGAVLSIAGGTIVTVARSSARTKRRLLTAGVRAPATVAEVQDMNLRVNGRTQWRLKYRLSRFSESSPPAFAVSRRRRSQPLEAGGRGGSAVRSGPSEPCDLAWKS